MPSRSSSTADARALGLKSTIVGLTGVAGRHCCRPGAIAREEIEAVVGPLGVASDRETRRIRRDG